MLPKGMGNLNKLMKQAQEMQGKMAKVQEDLGEREVEGASGGGAVAVRMTCKMEVRSLKIRPDVVDPEDVEMLEDMILVALNDARKKAEDVTEKEMAKVTGGLGGMPGMF